MRCVLAVNGINVRGGFCRVVDVFGVLDMIINGNREYCGW